MVENDAISRQAAIDAIYHHLPSVSRTRARTMLHEVPSVQPERPKGKWNTYYHSDTAVRTAGTEVCKLWADCQ